MANAIPNTCGHVPNESLYEIFKPTKGHSIASAFTAKYAVNNSTTTSLHA
jgi:hypothetical protein